MGGEGVDRNNRLRGDGRKGRSGLSWDMFSTERMSVWAPFANKLPHQQLEM
jgi:hypothetical protein